MSKRQLNLLSFFKKKEALHDSKRVRKAGDEGSCSGHVEGKNRLQQEASAASRVHPQLAKPGQEAGTVAAAGQVHRQPEQEQEPATALAVSQVDHQQPEQHAGTLASASPVQQPEQEAGTAAMTSAGSQEEDLEGEGSVLSGDGTSGMGCTVWTATQFKVKQSYYPWLLMKNTGFGCTTWRYTELSQRGIGENSFHGITLNGGKSSDKTLDPKQFFLTVAKNLKDCMLSQGGWMPDKTGYNKFIEELMVLYAQYWPEDAGVLYGETEVESLCQRFNIDNLRAVIRAYETQMEKTPPMS
ncbi:unnamed protein product [Boreogadus saida]